MSDNKDKTDFRGRTQINLNKDYEVQYWTEKWGISTEDLREAIETIDSINVYKLEEYLNTKN